MADFNLALSKVLTHEGYYSQIQKDRGGETYCGISRVNHPDWDGWTAVDKFKSEFGQPQWGQQIHDADKFVEEFYRKAFWNQILGDKIENQYVANLIFDASVNLGVKGSVLIAQEVLRDCFGCLDITLDGKVGHKTIDGLNKINKGVKPIFDSKVPSSYIFLVQFTALRMRRYARLASDGGQHVFIKGWTARAFSFLGSKG